jgi:hypothetical protein
MTGFNFTLDSTEQFSTSAQLTGQAFAADYAVPTPALLTEAMLFAEAAYDDAAGKTMDANKLNYGSGILGGDFGGKNDPLTGGVYTFGSVVTIAEDIYFNGTNADEFVIRMSGDLIVVKGKKVVLQGVLAKNIYWQVAGYAEVRAGAHMEGILMVKTHVALQTNSSINGRIMAQTACTLQQANVTAPSL